MRRLVLPISLGAIIACDQGEGVWQAEEKDTLAVLELISKERHGFPVELLSEPKPLPFNFPYELVPFDDTLNQRFFPRGFQRRDLKLVRADTLLIFAPDTTCTTLIWVKFRGRVEIECDSATPLLRDSIYARHFTHKDTVIEKRLHGELFQWFLLRKRAGRWERVGVSGGVEISSPEVAAAPRLDYLLLKVGEDPDTIWPDTVHYGLRRFYHPDSFLGCPPHLPIEVVGYGSPDTLLPFIWANSLRRQPGPVNFPEGDHWFSFEVVPPRVFVYPGGEYRSLRWAVRLRIGGG